MRYTGAVTDGGAEGHAEDLVGLICAHGEDLAARLLVLVQGYVASVVRHQLRPQHIEGIMLRRRRKLQATVGHGPTSRRRYCMCVVQRRAGARGAPPDALWEPPHRYCPRHRACGCSGCSATYECALCQPRGTHGWQAKSRTGDVGERVQQATAQGDACDTVQFVQQGKLPARADARRCQDELTSIIKIDDA